MIDPGRPAGRQRYLTLAAARALQCNGCGDCCDSRRTDGFWAWGALPAEQYRDRCDGKPLIIPLEWVDGAWQDRAYRMEDAGELSATRFRCAAFSAGADGGGSCLRHDRWRPSPCEEFPVWGGGIAAELVERGEVPLQTGAFPRCTWFNMVIVRDGDPRLPADAAAVLARKAPGR